MGWGSLLSIFSSNSRRKLQGYSGRNWTYWLFVACCFLNSDISRFCDVALGRETTRRKQSQLYASTATNSSSDCEKTTADSAGFAHGVDDQPSHIRSCDVFGAICEISKDGNDNSIHLWNVGFCPRIIALLLLSTSWLTITQPLGTRLLGTVCLHGHRD